MSADLFAEFESFSQPAPPPPNQQRSPAPSVPFQADFLASTRSPAQQSYTRHQSSSSWTTTPAPQQANWNSGGWSTGQTAEQGNAWPALSNTTHVQSSTAELNDFDDDGWGDFEVAPAVVQSQPHKVPTVPPAPPATSSTSAREHVSGTQPVSKEVPLRTRVVRASTMDLMTNNLIGSDSAPIPQERNDGPSWGQQQFDWGQQRSSPQSAPKPATKRSSEADPNVLFDVDDFDCVADEDDDFGDFETGVAPSQQMQDLLIDDDPPSASVKKAAPSSLSMLDISNSGSFYPTAPKSPSYQERNPFPGLSLSTPPAEVDKQLAEKSNATPVTAWPSANPAGSPGSIGGTDDWGAFEDFPEEPANPTKTQATSSAANWDWDSVEPENPPAPSIAPTPSTKLDSTWDWAPERTTTEPTVVDGNKTDLPPINIPPPSILLSIFPQLLELANSTLFKPMNGQSSSIKNRVLSDPTTIKFLRSYLALATVSARIIAGRKSRWHRDKFLTQSMSISASGSKGMKLAGVDKTQATRDQREAADVVAFWKEHVGRLRSAVAAANTTINNSHEHLKLPEISENLHVNTAKGVPTAPKACIICGLKRDERVARVDLDVEDSFGEWWVDHWGHASCKRFWLEHEVALRQR